jgi:ketosteroid isomerase-like protein
MSGRDEEILQLEKARNDAILARDTTTLEKLYDDELVYMRSYGRLDTKAGFIESMKRGNAHYKSYTYSNVKVRHYGYCAIVSGDLELVTKTRQNLRFTSVWYKRDGQWRNVHWATSNYAEAARV